MIHKTFVAAGLVLSLAGPALAGRVSGAVEAPTASTAAQFVPPVVPTPAPQPAPQPATDHSSLREGVIAEIEDSGARLKVNGSWLRVADGTTRIFRRGAEVRSSTLLPGQSIRFTLAPDAPDRLTLGVVYAP